MDGVELSLEVDADFLAPAISGGMAGGKEAPAVPCNNLPSAHFR
jgi:hypothetical protein